MRRHPSGFILLCIAVLCERCAAYMLASSVVLMLCQRYGYAQKEALRFAGQFSALSYAGTIFGGLAADRVLGHRRALGGSMLLLTWISDRTRQLLIKSSPHKGHLYNTIRDWPFCLPASQDHFRTDIGNAPLYRRLRSS